MPAMFESGVFTEATGAWHGEGVVVDDMALDAERCLELSGLGGWEMEKLPLYTRVGTREIVVPGKFAHTRMKDQRILGVVGNVYTGVTNEDAFRWCDELVGGFGCHYKTAGSLYGGRVVWMLLEVPFDIDLPDGKLRNMLYLTNTHDGSAPVEAAFTSVRIVCANTLKLARHSGVDRVRIKHTESAPQRLAAAQQAMHLVEGARERTAKLAEQLFAQRVLPEQFEALVDEVFPLPKLPVGVSRDDLTRGQKMSLTIAENKRDAVRAQYFGSANGAPDVFGTAWGAYNAFSAAYQHQDIDGKDREARERKAQTIFDNIMNAKSPADQALAVLTR